MNNINFELDEIVDIKYLGNNTTIDIEVDGDHLFFADDILTHNSQFNREVLNKPIDEISEGNIGESWKKVKIADCLIAMAATAEERLQGVINMKGLKNRNGPKDFIINMKIIYELLRITDGKSNNNASTQKKKRKNDEE